MPKEPFEVKLHAEDIMKDTAFKVTIVESYPFQFRKFIAIKLVHLAAYILGMGFELNDDAKSIENKDK